mmetsp:Transcript_9583/g.16551  ORF Transcript_9583/g.16551 Transcript_9583/m.16551 type:complete len:649 (-) Transcript_9583:286-2232(-)
MLHRRQGCHHVCCIIQHVFPKTQLPGHPPEPRLRGRLVAHLPRLLQRQLRLARSERHRFDVGIVELMDAFLQQGPAVLQVLHGQGGGVLGGDHQVHQGRHQHRDAVQSQALENLCLFDARIAAVLRQQRRSTKGRSHGANRGKGGRTLAHKNAQEDPNKGDEQVNHEVHGLAGGGQTGQDGRHDISQHQTLDAIQVAHQGGAHIHGDEEGHCAGDASGVWREHITEAEPAQDEGSEEGHQAARSVDHVGLLREAGEDGFEAVQLGRRRQLEVTSRHLLVHLICKALGLPNHLAEAVEQDVGDPDFLVDHLRAAFGHLLPRFAKEVHQCFIFLVDVFEAHLQRQHFGRRQGAIGGRLHQHLQRHFHGLQKCIHVWLHLTDQVSIFLPEVFCHGLLPGIPNDIKNTCCDVIHLRQHPAFHLRGAKAVALPPGRCQERLVLMGQTLEMSQPSNDLILDVLVGFVQGIVVHDRPHDFDHLHVGMELIFRHKGQGPARIGQKGCQHHRQHANTSAGKALRQDIFPKGPARSPGRNDVGLLRGVQELHPGPSEAAQREHLQGDGKLQADQQTDEDGARDHAAPEGQFRILQSVLDSIWKDGVHHPAQHGGHQTSLQTTSTGVERLTKAAAKVKNDKEAHAAVVNTQINEVVPQG